MLTEPSGDIFFEVRSLPLWPVSLNNGTIFDVAAQTHLQQGLVSLSVASPCAWLIGLVTSCGDSQDEI